MKSQFLQKRFSIIVFICLVILGLLISYTISQSQSSPTAVTHDQPTRPSNCVPFPWLSENKNSGTPRPSLQELLDNPDLIKTIPTVKPDTITNTYDLRPDLPGDQKFSVYVFRCNGSEDLYLVDPRTYGTGNSIHLDAGDVIIGVSSPADMYFHGIPPTSTSPFIVTVSPLSRLMTFTPSPKGTQFTQETLPPYPPPISPTPTITAILPSPYPPPPTNQP